MRDPVIQFVDVTPQMAEKWLRVSAEDQRTLRPRLVAKYADEMKRGEWKTTHQGIAFGSAGRLIDGQHRLHAIVASGVTVRMAVARQVDGGYENPIDLGAGRKVGDILHLSHHVVAVCGVLGRLRTGIHVGTSTGVTPSLVEDLYENEKKHVDAVIPLVSRGGTAYRISAAAGAGIAYVRPLNPEATDRFLEKIRTGAIAQATDPALRFREWYPSTKGSTGSSVQALHAMGALRAAWASVNGEKLSRIYARARSNESDPNRALWSTDAYKEVSAMRQRMGFISPERSPSS
jgi:hypothetical protein